VTQDVSPTTQRSREDMTKQLSFSGLYEADNADDVAKAKGGGVLKIKLPKGTQAMARVYMRVKCNKVL